MSQTFQLFSSCFLISKFSVLLTSSFYNFYCYSFYYFIYYTTKLNLLLYFFFFYKTEEKLIKRKLLLRFIGIDIFQFILKNFRFQMIISFSLFLVFFSLPNFFILFADFLEPLIKIFQMIQQSLIKSINEILIPSKFMFQKQL